MSPVLRLLSAGAAQGLAGALGPKFESVAGCELRASFMPVGALEEELLAGEGCDVVVSTDAMLARFAEEGRIDGATIAPLGRVPTGIAVKAGERPPAIDGEDRLRAALSAATRLYVPDPQRATAGIHFVNVLRKLELYDRLAPRLATCANGVAAMRALAAGAERGSLGCTQVTEIRYTAGVTLVGSLPPPFDLATAYAAAVSASASDPAPARRFVALLTGRESADARRAAGFEP